MIPAGPLERAAIAARIDALDLIAKTLVDRTPTTDEEFRDAIRGAILCGVQASQLAAAVPIAVSSITRWSQGSYVPRKALRPKLGGAIVRVVLGELASLRESLDPAAKAA